jgi:hypothetical protein
MRVMGYSIGDRPEIPPIGDPDRWKDAGHASRCRTFLDQVFIYDTMKRAELERDWNRTRLYDARRQWLRPYNAGGGRLWFTWEPIRFKRGHVRFPMPIRNIFSPAIQNETARLIGVGAKPYVRLDDESKEEGARVAKQVLLGRNEQTKWDRENRKGAYHAAAFGQWICEVGWQVDRTQTVRGPVLEAVKCPTCDFALAEPSVSALQAQDMNASNPMAAHTMMEPGQEPRFEARDCPSCGVPLEPYEPPPEVYQGQLDAIGRPLGKDRPLGEEYAQTKSPYSFWPANQGIGYESVDEMMEYGFREPKALHWLSSHYENGRLVKQEGSYEAYQHHPVVSAWGLVYNADRLWQGYNLLDRWYLKPCPEFPRGRAIEMAGYVLLYDGEYYIPGTDIPRSDVQVAPWELREGEIWGKSLAEDLFSVQDNINSGIALAMDIQQKWTSPKLILHEGMNLQFEGGANGGYASDIWTVNTRGLPPEMKDKFPMPFGNTGAPGTLWQLYDRDTQHVQTASGAMDPEVGNVSGVELNYSALVFAASRSAERRRPRVDGFRLLKRAVFTARLRLIAALYREDRLIRYRDDSEKWAVRQVRGFMLEDQTDVALEDEPLVDTGVAIRASIAEAAKYGTLKTSMQGAPYGTDRRINRALGLPENLTEDRNAQEDEAINEWKTYVDEEEEPVIDQQADNDMIHLQVHTLSLDGREARELREALKGYGLSWGNVLKAAWEWERLLTDLTMIQQLVAKAPKPEDMLKTGMPPVQMQAMQQQIQEQRMKVLGFPSVLELRVENVWLRLLAVHGIQVQSPELKKLVRFKAHTLAHWLRLQPGHPALAGAMPPAGGGGMAPAMGPAGLPQPGPGAPPPGPAPAPAPDMAAVAG